MEATILELIISNANILYGEELDLIHDHSVWIQDGIIKKIVPNNQAPKNIETIDANGSYLLPGLIDLHVHIMWDGSINPVATSEKEGYEQMIIRAVSTCQKYIQNGITAIRDLGSIDDIALHVEQGIKRGLITGPRLIASGKTLTMTGGHDPFWARFCDGPIEALKATREQIYKNAQVIKVSATGGVYGRSEGESVDNVELNFEELKAICDEAHKFGLKVASHAIGREGILNSIRAGVDTIEHGHFLDDELIQMMEEKNIAWVPTLCTYQKNATAEGIPAYAQEKAKKIVDIHGEAFKNFFYRNILVGAGSDAGAPALPHPAIVSEMISMNEFIFNKRDILKTATSNAGKILGMKIGQIAEGYMADFILVNQNPLENLQALTEVEQVFLNGKKVKDQISPSNAILI